VTRADKQRNRELLVAAAARIIDRDGAGASLEQIAREAGVGSATLHRHFSSRRELLAAVFHDRLEMLCRRAAELSAESDDDGEALVRWLGELAAYVAVTHGLATALFAGPAGEMPVADSCHAMLVTAGGELLDGAVAAGRVRSDVRLDDLIALANGVAVAAEDDAPTAERLITLAMRGIEAR
jgi:AcrR family transcriptional regulator